MSDDDLPLRPFGAAGFSVTAVGYGAGAVGDPAMPESEASLLLNGALDLGIGLIDAARSYGLSEERIGRHLRGRRSEFVLSTKVGYGVPGLEDWTGACVAAGVDLALTTLRTEVLDVVHLHSCPLETLQRGEVAQALLRAVEAGKVRVAAYSGDNEAADWAVSSGLFGSLQISANVCDQRALVAGTLDRARERGLAVIAKRPLANAPWRPGEPPAGDQAASAYRQRWHELDLDLRGLPPAELALRFSANLPGVSAAIVGGRSLENLRGHVRAIADGPLPDEVQRLVLDRFRELGADWPGMV